MLKLGSSLVRGGASLLTFVKDNLKLYLDFTSTKSDTLKFPSEGSTEFSGSSQYIDCGTGIGTSLGDNYAGSLTVSLWFKADVTNSNDGLFNIGSFSNTQGEFAITIESNILRFKLNAVSWHINHTSFTSTDWNHVACVYSAGNESNSKMYLNGVSVGSASGSFPSASDMDFSGLKTIIGAYYSSGYPFDGKIANVALWSRELSPEEIQSIMNKSYSQLKGVEKTSLVAWWSLDSASNGVVQPSTGEVLGAERVLNSDFSDGGNLWTLNNANVVNEVLEIDEGAFSYYAQQSVDGGGSAYRQFESGYLMKLEIVVDEYTSGGTIIYATGNNIGTFNSAGTHTIYYKPSANEYLRLRSDGGGFEGKISSVSIKRVTSNTGVVTGATTTTSVYGGNAPILPRAVDVAKEGQADAIGNGSASFNIYNTDYIEIKNTGFVLQNWSISFWVRTGANLSGSYPGIVNTRSGNNNDYQDGLTLQYYNDYFDAEGASQLGHLSKVAGNTNLDDGEWYHVVHTCDRNGTNKQYINGIFITEKTAVDNPTNADTIQIGARFFNNTVRDHWDGDIAQVGFWQGILDQPKVQKLYESTSYLKIPADVKSTLGSELITNGTFDSDISGWGKSNISNTPDVTYNNGKARIAYSSSGNTINIGINTTNNPFNGISGTVKVTGNIQIISGSISSGSSFQVYETNTANNVSVTPDSNGDFTAYIKVGTNNQLGIYASADVCTFEVDNISAKLVTNDIVAYYPLDGSSSANGVTQDVTTGETLGSELISNGSFDTDTTGWIKNNGSMDVVNGELKVITSSSYWEGVRYNFGAVVNGGIYKAVFTARLESGNTPQVQFSGASGSSTYSNATFISGSSNVTYTFYFIANANNSNTYLTFFNGAASSSTFYLDNVSLKKVTSNTGVLK